MQARYEAAFNRTRTANAVLNALHGDSLEAAVGTAHEMIAGIGLPADRALSFMGAKEHP